MLSKILWVLRSNLFFNLIDVTWLNHFLNCYKVSFIHDLSRSWNKVWSANLIEKFRDLLGLFHSQWWQFILRRRLKNTFLRAEIFYKLESVLWGSVCFLRCWLNIITRGFVYKFCLITGHVGCWSTKGASCLFFFVVFDDKALFSDEKVELYLVIMIYGRLKSIYEELNFRGNKISYLIGVVWFLIGDLLL